LSRAKEALLPRKKLHSKLPGKRSKIFLKVLKNNRGDHAERTSLGDKAMSVPCGIEKFPEPFFPSKPPAKFFPVRGEKGRGEIIPDFLKPCFS